MPIHLTYCLAVVLALGSASMHNALAQGSSGSDSSAEQQWGVGLGLNVKQKAYADIGTTTTAIPLLSFENRWIRFAGPTVDLKLPASGALSAAVRARYAFEDGYEPDDARILSGMDERKSSLWIGAATTWRHEIGSLSVEWLGDVSDYSKGQRARLVAEKPFRLGDFRISPRVAMNWLDRKYVDYYFGVTEPEARAGRPVYQGRSAANTELGLRIVHAFGSGHSVYLDFSATRLDSPIRNSPLAGRSTEGAFRAGYVYQLR